jgi:hypothetical protein
MIGQQMHLRRQVGQNPCQDLQDVQHVALLAHMLSGTAMRKPVSDTCKFSACGPDSAYHAWWPRAHKLLTLGRTMS